SSPPVDVSGPLGFVAGVGGEERDGRAQAMVAGPSKADAVLLARGVGDGHDTGLGSEVFFRNEARTLVAEFRHDLSRVDAAAARQGHDDAPFGQLRDLVLDARADGTDLRNELLEHQDQSASKLAFGFGFELSDARLGGLS